MPPFDDSCLWPGHTFQKVCRQKSKIIRKNNNKEENVKATKCMQLKL